MSDRVVVVLERNNSVVVQSTSQVVKVNAGTPGPRGAPGAIGGFEHVQAIPMGTWTISVPPEFGRRPNVEVYVGDERVLADLVADAISAVITFAFPVAGTAVLT